MPFQKINQLILLCSLCVRRDNAIYDFSKKAVENGLDIFRVFDSLNYIGKRLSIFSLTKFC